MSRELIGNYGIIVDSVHYFEQLNRENHVGNRYVMTFVKRQNTPNSGHRKFFLAEGILKEL